MSYVHTVRRRYLSGHDYDEEKHWIWIPVYYSPSEHRYHRVLPDCLAKFKHYILNTIAMAVNHDNDLDQYSFPSDSSIRRWRKLACDLLRRKAELKHSVSSVSLPDPLHDHFRSGCADIVDSVTVIYKFSAAELGRLLLYNSS